MGREVRRVPPTWEHPKDEYGQFHPMFAGSFQTAFDEWMNNDLPEWLMGRKRWLKGEVTDYAGGWEPIPEKHKDETWEEYAGTAPTSPDPRDYMPDWPLEERTHYMMYETVIEGTPISPAFATPEELARWLCDSGASAFGDQTASYEWWLRVCKGGYAPSMVIANGVAKTGVDAF